MRFGNLSKLLLGLGVAAFAVPARADVFFSQLGTLNPPANPASNVIRVDFTSGATYSNVVGTPGVGSPVYAVGAAIIASATTTAGTTLQSGFWTAAGGNVGVAVFAVQGTITSVSVSSATLQFNAGQINVYAVPGSGSGTFNPLDPGTWGTSGPSLAQWTLATPADITQGNPNADSGSFAAAQVNVISGSIAANQLLSGTSLWDKPASNTLLVASTFDPFGIGSVLKEQLETRVNETIQSSYGGAGSIPVSSLIALLNAILANAGLSSNGFNDFDPNNLATTLDFFATLQGEAVPGVQFFIIPEPASALIWGSLGLGALALCRLRRRTSTALTPV